METKRRPHAEAWSCGASVVAADLDAWRRAYIQARRKPELSFLVWHATHGCNYRCRHCFVEPTTTRDDLDTREALRVFDNVARSVPRGQVRVGISGGEPTLRKDLPEVVRHINSLGFVNTGLASNGFLLGRHPERLDALVEAGLRCLNVSLDGPPEYHNALRRHPRAYDMAVAALRHAATHRGLDLSITVTVSPDNQQLYPHVFDVAGELGVSLVKVVSVEPYGRGAANPDLHLDNEALVTLLRDVAARRVAYEQQRTPLLVTMTDDGFLGCFEGSVRSGLFQCPAGVSLAAILHDGRLSACPQLKQDFSQQGNLLVHDFGALWRDGFRPFRQREWLHQGACRNCAEWRYCMGGSLHDRGESGELLRCNTQRLRQVWERWMAEAGTTAR